METSTCLWCHKDFVHSRLGRSAKYCKNSCKQRAYESRKFGIGEMWEHFQSAYVDCYLCGERLDWAAPQSLCVDHMIATVHGGRTDVENLRPVHLICNARKGARLYVTENLTDEIMASTVAGLLSHGSDEKEADSGN